MATTAFARAGNYVIAYEERIVNSLGQLTRFRVDIIIQRIRGIASVNSLIEGKSLNWWLWYSRGQQAWFSQLGQLERQAQAFQNSDRVVSGVRFQERVIVFASKAPKGLEQAQLEVQQLVSKYYDKIFWSIEEFEAWVRK